MSFITKRERVFNEYDLFDLPARNEGKLKTYASCTDARAWSHFCSDKSEHLIEIIKRNNETMRPKYIPTDVIVNTLMTAKNGEVARLKRKIGEFEQMLLAYDQLDLTCDQKCDIANAHAAIKAANKELDDMCLDLDLSGYTEGIDSEAFETGQSRGDELSRYTEETGKSGGDEIKVRSDEWAFDKEKESTPRKETKSSQAGTSCTCDASTSAHDTQVEEMQETIIGKDAKLSAMQNTIAVMEHDVCEPYCIYAHIYTALEKIFGTLCQNEKYKHYLDLLTAGKDTRDIDIKGKILFKMKVLEKFSLALIAPCSQDFSYASRDCSCYRAEVLTHVEATFALTSAEGQNPSLDNKRAHLVADIMENQEMREILSKECLCGKNEDDQLDECFEINEYNTDVENLNRLKNLQANYEELLNYYDNLKHERDCLYLQCKKNTDLENECDCLKNDLREYNQLWKEKEYYRKRSEHLDTLKENYFVLSEETLNIETKFKAEQEINKSKSETVDELRNENIRLEQKIGDASVMYEKQKNTLSCKLKDCECTIMCQEQQIKTLSVQLDKLLEQNTNKVSLNEEAVQRIDETESQKHQIQNLRDGLCSSEEEKQYLQENFEKKLELINELELDVEDWKSKYDEAVQNNSLLGKYLDMVQIQVNELQNKNLLISRELENSTNAIENLNNITCSKSQEISALMEDIGHKEDENSTLISQMNIYRDSFNKSLASLVNERKITMNLILSARQESIVLFNKLIDHDNTKIGHGTKKESVIDNNVIEDLNKMDETDKKVDQNIDNDVLVKEIELLQKTNIKNINILQCENEQLKRSLDLAKQENQILEQNLKSQESLLQKFEKLKHSQEILINEKETLQFELNDRKYEIDKKADDLHITKKKSEDILNESVRIKEQHSKLNAVYEEVMNEKSILQKKIFDQESETKTLMQSLNLLKFENESLLSQIQKIQTSEKILIGLQESYIKLLSEKEALQRDFENKTEEINLLNNELKIKVKENQQLHKEIKDLQFKELTANGNISAMKNENSNMLQNVDAAKQESIKLLDKMKYYEKMENDYDDLKLIHNEIKVEKENLQNDLNLQSTDLRKLHQENNQLNDQNINLSLHCEILEKALIQSRNELSSKTDISDCYDDIKKQIENLKEEKLDDLNKIRSLMEKLDESEYFITNLGEDIVARDKRLLILENHINELEDEIRALQNDLVKVVESGEQLKELSYEKINQSLKEIQAHQSKATQNMKKELTKLQNEKQNLTDQVSNTKLKTEEALKEKHQYLLQINLLQSEREVLISDIRKLELKSIGDSDLSPSNCSINEAITSLDRISKYLDNKNTCLEQTLLSVQASYQLLKSKADEAKAIAERERQKIIYEKEQTKLERMDIEKRLDNLKAEIKEEEVNYNKVIKDLEGELLNQKLIYDKKIQSKGDHILKLIEEKNLLQDQYNNTTTELKELKDRLQNAFEQKTEKIDLIERANTVLEEKDKLVLALKKELERYKNKSTQHSGIQSILFVNKKNEMCQTDLYDKQDTMDNKDSLPSNNIISEKNTIVNKNVEKFEKSDISKDKKFSDMNPINPPINEIQILTANVEPTKDFVKNIYLKNKLKRLSAGKLEQYSIASTNDNKILNDNRHGMNPIDGVFGEDKFSEILPDANMNIQLNRTDDSVIDIYNAQISSNSTKLTNEICTDVSNKESKSLFINLANDNENCGNSLISYNKGSIDPTNFYNSVQSTEKDLFVIYKDSDSFYDKNTKLKNFENVDMFINNASKENSPKHIQKPKRKRDNEKSSDNKNDESVKSRLKVILPVVLNDTHSTITSGCDDKSLDLHISATHITTEQVALSETSIICKDVGKFKLNIISVPVTNSSKNKIVFENDSNHQLSRVDAKILVLQNTINNSFEERLEDLNFKSNAEFPFVFDTVQNETNPNNTQKRNVIKVLQESYSNERFIINESNQSSPVKISSIETSAQSPIPTKYVSERGTLVRMDAIEDYEDTIQRITETLEKDYKKKIDAVKVQYDSNVKCIINEHNCGVQSIQSLHEDTLNDIIKIHENEVENLRTMSIEAMRRVEKLELENRCLKTKLNNNKMSILDEELIKIPSSQLKKRKCRCRVSSRTLTTTNVEAFNVKPERRSYGPCTCSLDMNISDTIRNIFEQVDVEQRKMAEQAYLKYIANKILDGTVETLDAQELSFLHLKVCRTWKTSLHKEEALQKKIDSLENELINKQRQTQKHMAELDRKVAEEWRRLQEVREAVCRSSNPKSNDSGPAGPTTPVNAAEKDVCQRNTVCCHIAVNERLSAGDVATETSRAITDCLKRKRGNLENNKAVLGKLLADEACDGRRGKGPFSDETPTRLKRAHDRRNIRTQKK